MFIFIFDVYFSYQVFAPAFASVALFELRIPVGPSNFVDG